MFGTAFRVVGRHNNNILASATRVAFSPTSSFLQGQNSFVSASTASASHTRRTMGTIVKGVEFDTLAREWRCKWSTENDKKSLEEAQAALSEILAEVKAIDGVIRVDRVVCGGCQDFKVITSLPAGDKWAAWAATNHAPEEAFLAKLKSIDGVSLVETQTYTFMAM